MLVQFLPLSVVLKMYGLKSSNMCRSNDTYAVPAFVREGSTCDTGEFAATSVHVFDQVGPILPAVSRELQVAVVSANPDVTFLRRRLGDT